MVTTMMAPAGTSPFPGTTPTTSLAAGLNAALAALVAPVRPRQRVFQLPKLQPSVLLPAQTGWVCDALVVLANARPRVSFQTAARFIGWLELQYQYGCGGDTAEIAKAEWAKKGLGMQVCGGDYELFLASGLELMKQFGGFAADANVEPILLWIALADMVTKPAGEPLMTAVTFAAG